MVSGESAYFEQSNYLISKIVPNDMATNVATLSNNNINFNITQ